jgi:hypothetical protein
MHRLFTEQGFSRCMRAGDSRRFKISLATDRDKIIKRAIDAATRWPAAFTNYYKAQVKQRTCVSLKDYSQNLILRSISRYVARRFRIKPCNRDDIVRDVIETLSDSTPMYVLRRDIASFYENLPTTEAGQRILYDTFMPTKLKAFVRRYFDTFCTPDVGVPRGVGLSALIAELAMQRSDQKIRETPGVYKYFRYSDDILIFSYRPPSEISAAIESALPPPVRLNPKKSTDTSAACPNKHLSATKSFEYLGYRFTFKDHFGSSSPRTVTVSISQRKISKLKSRIICSLKSYAKGGDASLLLDRIRFVAGNYRAYRKGASAIRSSKILRSGIYYSYSLCGTYKGAKRTDHTCAELKYLDGFYHSLLTGPSSLFKNRLALNPPLLARLKDISFFKGYEKRMIVRFHPDRIQQIKRAWRNG